MDTTTPAPIGATTPETQARRLANRAASAVLATRQRDAARRARIADACNDAGLTGQARRERAKQERSMDRALLMSRVRGDVTIRLAPDARGRVSYCGTVLAHDEETGVTTRMVLDLRGRVTDTVRVSVDSLTYSDDD